MDIGGHKHPFGAKHVNSTILKSGTDMIEEVWVDLDEGFGTSDNEDIYPGVYVASAVSQVNSNTVVISILNSNEETIKVTNLKRFEGVDSVSVQKVESSISDNFITEQTA